MLASVLVLTAAGFATLATSSAPPPSVTSNTIAGTIDVDDAHPVAVQDFTVKLSNVAAVGISDATVSVSRSDQDRSIQLAVLTAEPGESISSMTPAPLYGNTTYTPRGLELGPGGTQTLTIHCEAGPCERRIRIVAGAVPSTFVGGGAGATLAVFPGSARWRASATLVYSHGALPSGAGVTLALGDLVSISGQGRLITAAIPGQHVEVEPTHPASATVVEVRLAAGAVPSNPGDAITTAVLDGGRQTQWDDGFGIEQIYPLGQRHQALDLANQFDPTIGCTPGRECVRTYMVYAARGFEYPDETGLRSYDFGFHVSQFWFRGSPPPADAVQVRVVAQLSVDPTAAQSLHFEGDLTLQPSNQNDWQTASVTVNVAPPSDTLSPPAAFVPYAPIPAVGEVVAVPVAGSAVSAARLFVRGDDLGSPFRRIRFDDDHPTETRWLSIYVGVHSDTKLSEPIKVHWSVNLTLYAYKDLPPFTMTKG